MGLKYQQAKDVVTRDITGETLLVPVRGTMADMERIFLLNEVGAFIWRLLDGRTCLDAIQKMIINVYEVDEETAAADTRELITSLNAAGLIDEVS